MDPGISDTTKGRASNQRNAKVPTDKPVAQVESAAASADAAEKEAEGEMPTDQDTGMIPFTSAGVDSAAREAQAKADARAAKADKKARVAEAVAAIEADEAETEAQLPPMPDVQPSFEIMDQESILRFMRVFRKWLRDRGAIVNGPTVAAVEVKNTSMVEQTREGAVLPEANREKETMTLYEGFFQWRYEGADMPVTVRRAHVTEIEALRATARESFVRRHEA